MGRPSKLTPDVQQTLVFALAEGASVEHACDYAGIAPKTFYNWMQRGETGEDEEYVQFFQASTRARGRGVVTDLTTISKAVLAGDWHAAAWRLQHRYPAAYGAKLTVSGDADQPLRHLHDLPQDQLEALITRLLQQTGYGAAPSNETPCPLGTDLGDPPDPEHREGVPL